MGELVFVGLGLCDESDMSLRGVEVAREADRVFAEFYTSLMPGLSLQKLEKVVRKKIVPVSRRDMEEENGEEILKAAGKGKAVLLVPGDPLIATTHVDLRIRAERRGVKTSVVHGASIISAVIGLSGLQNYKFGRSVTIPFSEQGSPAETPYRVVEENRKLGLHTICFLDIRAEEKRYMTIKDGLQTMLALEKQKKKRVITTRTLAVGVARAGSTNSAIKADYVENLMNFEFGGPPHTLVFPGKLHFMEAEALVTLAKAPETIREAVK